MTNPDSSPIDLAALAEDKRRYEEWLAALETRRDTTPTHIYERVQSDYRTRLQRVQEQLAVHRTTLDDERTSIESRLSLIDAEAQMRGDELAEIELRSHVGELATAETLAALNALKHTLEQLSTEREGLARRRAELVRLLAGRPAESPAATPRHSFDELRFLTGVVGAGGDQPRGSDGVQPRAEGAAAKGENPVPSAPPPVEPPAPPPPPGATGPRRVVPRDTPLAARVSGNAPIPLRPSAAAEPTKSLKCGECGGMNYPTEWYCERCGAELAAL